MHIVLVDFFAVPEQSQPEFLDVCRRLTGFIKTLPGFVEGFILENVQAGDANSIVTTAVWESEEALQEAMQHAQVEFQKTGVNPREVMERLGVKAQRAKYSRTAY